MSYCRFENTARDLADCVQVISNGEVYSLGDREKSGLKHLLALAIEVVKYEDLIIDGCTS
jgi:hypothetical protein